MATFPQDASAALGLLKSAIAAAGTLQGAPVSTATPIIALAIAAQAVMAADMALIDLALNTVSPDGADPTVFAAWILSAQANSEADANLAFANAYVGRIVFNLNAGLTQ
jgi:hypothetical protein